MTAKQENVILYLKKSKKTLKYVENLLMFYTIKL